MSRSDKKTHYALYFIVIGVVLVLLFVWFFLPHAPVDTEEAVENQAPVQQGITYTNDVYHFSLRYDPASFIKADALQDQSWRVNSTDPGELLIKLTLPKTFQPNTNFSEAFITVGASANANALTSCLHAENGETAAGVTQIGGTTFFVFTETGAGAGNLYETASYRVIQNGACIALESTIHSTNIGNYDPSQGVKVYDKSSVEALLRAVVNTFQFE